MYRCAIKAVFSAAIISIVILSCGETVDTPANAEEHASFIMEYDDMAGLDIGYVTSDDNIMQHVIDAFDDVGLSTDIRYDQSNIPSYSEYDPTWGHDYFPDNDGKLRNYASYLDNNDLPWHLFSVDTYEENQGEGATTYGRSAYWNQGIHLPPTPAEERYSMVFTQDIVDDYTEANETYLIPAALVTTAVHELGHQRAGLTCPSIPEYSKYHANECVMLYLSSTTIKLDPRFCQTIDNPEFQTTHCFKVIQENYGNY